MKKVLSIIVLTILLLSAFGAVSETEFAEVNGDGNMENGRLKVVDSEIVESSEAIKTSENIRAGLTEPCKSYVDFANGIPMLFVNGKPMPLTGYYGCVDVYYDNPSTEANEAEKHYDKYIRHIDYAAGGRLNVINLDIWWAGLDMNDTPPSSPADAAARCDWSEIDSIMDYAASKGVYVIILFRWRPYSWWYTMNKGANYYYCTQRNNTAYIEDSGIINGSVLMPSFAAPNLLKYADEVMKSMINRYKEHPALLGWKLSLGWTTENNYPGGGYYNSNGWFDYSPYMKEHFRIWLQNRYNNDLDIFRDAWENISVTFDTVEPPQPPEADDSLDNDVLNGPGDIRRSWYDWQIFRLEMKKLERDHFAALYKQYDPNHVVVAVSGGPFSGENIIAGANELVIDYYDYATNPNIDGVMVCPHVDEFESIIQMGDGIYNLFKYFQEHGKFTFIKLEKWKDPVPPNSIESILYFFTAMGAGILWDMGGIPAFGENLTPEDYPEFSSEYTEAERAIINRGWYLTQTVPHFLPRREKFAFIDDPWLSAMDNQETGYMEDKYWLSCYKGFDRYAAGFMFGCAGLEFDVLHVDEIVSNPELLNDYKAVGLVNIFRMSETFVDILVDYRNNGGGLFIAGRTGAFDEYGAQDISKLQRLLGISIPISEYKVNITKPQDTTWNFVSSDASGLINRIEGKTVDNYSFYHIPTFDYDAAGYTVIGYLSSNPEIATVGYKDKVVFWFSRLGWDVGIKALRTEEQFNTVCQFLRNLYDFYNVNHDETEQFEINNVGGWYKFLRTKEPYYGDISFDLTCLEDYNLSNEYIIYNWSNMTPISKLKPVDGKLTTQINLKEMASYLFSITKCTLSPSFIAAEWTVFEEERWNESKDLLTIYLETKTNTTAKIAIYLANRENYNISLNNGTILDIIRNNASDTLLVEFHSDNDRVALEISFKGEKPNLNIEKPLASHLYIFDREIMPTIFGNTIILGKITIKADAYSEDGIDRVEFCIDDELRYVDEDTPFEWLWNEKAFGTHEIKVIAYDVSENKAEDKINVIIFNFGG